MKARQNKNPHRITVQFVGGSHDAQITKLEWGEAQELIDAGRAISISRNLHKAAKLGIDIRLIKGDDRRNDTFIKEKINAQRSKDTERQKKKEKAREKVHSKENNG